MLDLFFYCGRHNTFFLFHRLNKIDKSFSLKKNVNMIFKIWFSFCNASICSLGMDVNCKLKFTIDNQR